MSSIFVSYVYGLMRHILYTTLQYNDAIGSTLSYFKWPGKWGLIFESRIIIKHDFFSNHIAMVYSFVIFTDVIFINLYLLLIKY